MIQGLWEPGQLPTIHTYCRQDVIQTYFLFLRMELMRGHLTPHAYEAAWDASSAFLSELPQDSPADRPVTEVRAPDETLPGAEL